MSLYYTGLELFVDNQKVAETSDSSEYTSRTTDHSTYISKFINLNIHFLVLRFHAYEVDAAT